MSWRTYRFPPLLQLPVSAGSPQHDGQQDGQQAALDGYRQGMELGYSEGYAGGEQAGLAAGQEAGYQAGLAAGREAGRQEALAQLRAEFADAARPLEAVTAAMERARVDYQAALRDDVINLVAKVAKQVIRCELALKPAQILALVEETLAALPPLSGEVEVLLNSEEFQRISELAPERASRWALRADNSLAHGEVRIRSAESSIDAGCAQRLDACVDRLREQLAQDAHEPASTDSMVVAPVSAEQSDEAATLAVPVAKPRRSRSAAAKIDSAETAVPAKPARSRKAKPQADGEQ